ncbi:hypothetical protein [Anaerophilus nitritogenes]|uniref:hypothetical protein n=1 Tax=Anaerophilus nitritogenes TaxID=2498136 RepID=UPI0013EC3C0C|nr:hypothetical protein [Anaerophilus nitritogenes]
MDNRIKIISAIIFQFTIIAMLFYCLVTGIGGVEVVNTIVGALIGLAVGIGVNNITDI